MNTVDAATCRMIHLPLRRERNHLSVTDGLLLARGRIIIGHSKMRFLVPGKSTRL
jgi:hypothetical protein